MGIFFSQYLFAFLLPHFCIIFTSLGFHESSETERTNEMWQPRLRWIPEHWMQTKVPSVADAQRGALAGQSAHTLLAGSFSSLSRIFLCAASSAALLRAGAGGAERGAAGQTPGRWLGRLPRHTRQSSQWLRLPGEYTLPGLGDPAAHLRGLLD